MAQFGIKTTSLDRMLWQTQNKSAKTTWSYAFYWLVKCKKYFECINLINAMTSNSAADIVC